MAEIKTIAPSIRQLIIRDLGKYGGNSGVNKLYYLLNVIDSLIEHIGEIRVIEEVDKELNKLKAYRIANNVPTNVKMESWKDIHDKLEELRPKLAEIQFAYDDIKDKEFRRKMETEKKINYKKLTRKVSPYQPEIYFLFNLLMKISNMGHQTIPVEAFKTPQMERLVKTPFVRPGTPTPIKEGEVKEV